MIEEMEDVVALKRIASTVSDYGYVAVDEMDNKILTMYDSSMT